MHRDNRTPEQRATERLADIIKRKPETGIADEQLPILKEVLLESERSKQNYDEKRAP